MAGRFRKLEGHERFRLGKMTHPVRGLLHGSAAVFSLVGTILITVLPDGDLGRRLSLLVFGLSLVALFTSSTLYHSIPWGDAWKRRFQAIDITMVHVLIAGSATPLAYIVLDGWQRWVNLAVQWSMVLIGATVALLIRRAPIALSITLEVTQGWLGLGILWPLTRHLPGVAVGLILFSGILYTAGMIMMVTNRPRLWPRVFSAHEVFHVCVVAAGGVHFAVVARWVSNYGIA
jgi:hemolysin III